MELAVCLHIYGAQNLKLMKEAYMGKSIVQFLATEQEIFDFIDEIRNEHRVTIMKAKKDTPNSYSMLLTTEKLDDSNFRFFYIKLGDRYEVENSLFICIGDSDFDSIRESVISIKGDGEEFNFWKKQISSFRNKLFKGAYVLNPHSGSKTYYKNIYYTKNAKIAYDDGKRMRPIAGWNHYLLE